MANFLVEMPFKYTIMEMNVAGNIVAKFLKQQQLQRLRVVTDPHCNRLKCLYKWLSLPSVKEISVGSCGIT